MTLPELAIKRHVLMLMLIVSLTVLGTVALFRLPLAFIPPGSTVLLELSPVPFHAKWGVPAFMALVALWLWTRPEI